MVNVGFVVEGDSDVYLPQSPAFRAWVRSDLGIEVLDPVVNVGGNGNLCSRKVGDFVESLRIQARPEKIVILADLDPDACAPCIEQRKRLMSAGKVDAIIITPKSRRILVSRGHYSDAALVGRPYLLRARTGESARNALGSSQGNWP